MRTALIILIAGVLFPALAIGGYINALSYDPFTETFYPKQALGGDPELPGSLRMIGAIIIGMGGIFAVGSLRSENVKQAGKGTLAAIAWVGLMIAAYGGSFFVAAETAQDKIEERIGQGG